MPSSSALPRRGLPFPARWLTTWRKRLRIKWPARPPSSCFPIEFASTFFIPDGRIRPASANSSPKKCCGAPGPIFLGVAWPDPRKSPAASSSWSIRNPTTSPARRFLSTAARNCLGGPSVEVENTKAKSETRNSKSETNPKFKIRKKHNRPFLDFGFGIYFGFRISHLLPAEPLERQNKRDDSPGRHDADAPSNGS